MRLTTPTPAALLAVLCVVAVAVLGCGQDDSAAPPPSSVSDAIDAGQRAVACYATFDGLQDCDGDGVANAADVVPGRADLGDDDGDSVANKFDRYPSMDDRTFDIDRDGTADYRDTFFGDNRGDVDRDGLLNGYDLQPYAAPPGGSAVTPPPAVTEAQLVDDMLLAQMGRKYSAELLGPKPDRDFDGIPDDSDTSPTQFTNDRDADGDPDYYDPEPGDPYLDSRNDPYDPRNDEYWED